MTGKNIGLFFILTIFIFAGSDAYAQSDTTAQKKKLIESLKPAFDFDQRFSFIYNAEVNIWGGRAGVLVNEKFKVGVGAYFLSNNLKYKKLDQNGNPFYYAKRDVYFGTVYVEPFLLRKEYWELSIPVEIGYGKSYFTVYNGNNIWLGQEIKDFVPTGAGLSLSLKFPALFGFKPLRWIGINGLVGYRYSLLQTELQTAYDGMFWSISATFFLDRIFDDFRSWKKKRKDKDSERRVQKFL